MKARPTELPGVLLVEPQAFKDGRGWFMETYSEKKMQDIGITDKFVQDNHSYSANKGTVRGLHYQMDPMAQSKLVRCTRGRIYDVAVDIRKNSPHYGKWCGYELSAENHLMLYVPRGFAHAFQTLVDDVEVQYKVDSPYSKPHERGIRFDDPDISIAWPLQECHLAEKDEAAPMLCGADINFVY
jgi:dTDP-4-dehydrorhamnose 3,5-epimerase